jgi:hypothetical protein
MAYHNAGESRRIHYSLKEVQYGEYFVSAPTNDAVADNAAPSMKKMVKRHYVSVVTGMTMSNKAAYGLAKLR